MVEVEINGGLFNIRNKKNDITINQMVKCEDILSDDNVNELDKYINIIQQLSDLSIEEIEDLPIPKLKEVIGIINFEDINDVDLDFTNNFTIDGVKYVNRNEDINDIKLSVKEIYTIKDYFNNNDNKISVGEIAGVIFREEVGGVISRDFSVYKIKERAVIFGDLTLDIILPYVLNIKKHIS
tara:strand:+ start:80 stop:625 length:546 start_codon:yes stop_codon:yes gene_type:complete